jgi:hypothetical protein
MIDERCIRLTEGAANAVSHGLEVEVLLESTRRTVCSVILHEYSSTVREVKWQRSLAHLWPP